MRRINTLAHAGHTFAMWAALMLLSWAGLPVAAQPQPSPAPLMWVIQDDDSTLYLFGTVHAMREDVTWMTPVVQSAFDNSQDLWLEIADMDDTEHMATVARPFVTDPNHGLTNGLTTAETQDLKQRLAAHGLDMQALMGMRKWAVSLLLVQRQIEAMGLKPSSGIDMTLLKAARASAKPVHGFETVEQQLTLLSQVSEAEELATLRDSLRDLDKTPQQIETLITAWLNGDVKTLERDLVKKMRSDDPKGYRRFIAHRNADWAPRIKRLLDGQGTVFIAVGTAHLVGPDSVIIKLKRQGIRAYAVTTRESPTRP